MINGILQSRCMPIYWHFKCVLHSFLALLNTELLMLMQQSVQWHVSLIIIDLDFSIFTSQWQPETTGLNFINMGMGWCFEWLTYGMMFWATDMMRTDPSLHHTSAHPICYVCSPNKKALAYHSYENASLHRGCQDVAWTDCVPLREAGSLTRSIINTMFILRGPVFCREQAEWIHAYSAVSCAAARDRVTPCRGSPCGGARLHPTPCILIGATTNVQLLIPLDRSIQRHPVASTATRRLFRRSALQGALCDWCVCGIPLLSFAGALA